MTIYQDVLSGRVERAGEPRASSASKARVATKQLLRPPPPPGGSPPLSPPIRRDTSGDGARRGGSTAGAPGRGSGQVPLPPQPLARPPSDPRKAKSSLAPESFEEPCAFDDMDPPHAKAFNKCPECQLSAHKSVLKLFPAES